MVLPAAQGRGGRGRDAGSWLPQSRTRSAGLGHTREFKLMHFQKRIRASGRHLIESCSRLSEDMPRQALSVATVRLRSLGESKPQRVTSWRRWERSRGRRCNGSMNGDGRSRGAGLAAILILLAGACTSSPAAPSQARTSPEAGIPIHSVAGGCSGTVVTDSEPPRWAQGGWSHTKGTPWPVPWALGTSADALAYVFAIQLVAGVSPRKDGSNNKIAWVAKGNPSPNFVVEGRPLGQSKPVVSIPGGPSIVDVPTAGCWTFRLVWGPAYAGDTTITGEHTSTINLEVLPAGMLPSGLSGV